MDIMTSKNLALFSGVACAAVLATYAWAASKDASEVKVTEAAAEMEESAEPAPLCIPMAEANDATAETSEANTEGNAEVATTEEATTEASSEEAKAEDGASEAESALPICDENGNPPAAEAEASSEEATEAAAEEPAKTE